MSASGECQQLREPIQAMVQGCFDDLAPDEMTRVEAHLNDCSACAALLANETPPIERSTRAGGDASSVDDAPLPLPSVETPSAQAWEHVWDNVERATAPASARRKPQSRHIIRFLYPWSAYAAAAAIVLMVGLWRLVPRTQTWELDLAGAGDVEIQLLEVYGDAMPFVISGDEEGDVSMVWMLDDEGA